MSLARTISNSLPAVCRVNKIVSDYIAARGYQVPVFGSFNSDRDTVVARITPQSIERGVRDRVGSLVQPGRSRLPGFEAFRMAVSTSGGRRRCSSVRPIVARKASRSLPMPR